jgi:DNA polymerase-3 subunit alpha
VNKRACNKAKIELLDKIGAFASIEADQLSVNDSSRLKDQRELIPGLITGIVPVYREMNFDRYTKSKLLEIVGGYMHEHADDGILVKPTIGKKARFMVITDAPNSGEERLAQMAYGDGFNWISEALSEAELSRSDAYWTALIKRPKEGKQVSPSEISTYLPYLESEIALLKPPIIVLCGSTIVRQLIPDFKGKASDAAGKIIYNSDLDANMVIGFSPGEIWHSPEKQCDMNAVFKVVAELLE